MRAGEIGAADSVPLPLTCAANSVASRSALVAANCSNASSTCECGGGGGGVIGVVGVVVDKRLTSAVVLSAAAFFTLPASF